MSESTATLRHQIGGAEDLRSVVRTMKAVAASSIGQYQRSVTSLGEYFRTVQLGLSACFTDTSAAAFFVETSGKPQRGVTVVVFGSDQGLVGQFNDVMADFAGVNLANLASTVRPEVWAVGERVHARLGDVGVTPAGLFSVPHSIQAITPLIGHLLAVLETHHVTSNSELYLFYHRSLAGAGYAPVSQRLLPLDLSWQKSLVQPWPTKNLPQVMGDTSKTLQACLKEYLFVSLFRACAESLASENASRLAAMVRAEKNIDELLEDFHGTYRRIRQSGIDEELFDIIAGFEALTTPS